MTLDISPWKTLWDAVVAKVAANLKQMNNEDNKIIYRQQKAYQIKMFLLPQIKIWTIIDSNIYMNNKYTLSLTNIH